MLKALPDEKGIPEGDENNYSFGGLGHLIYKDQAYKRSYTRGENFTMIYKCIEFKAKKCQVLLKTKGKDLVSITGRHNHN